MEELKEAFSMSSEEKIMFTAMETLAKVNYKDADPKLAVMLRVTELKDFLRGCKNIEDFSSEELDCKLDEFKKIYDKEWSKRFAEIAQLKVLKPRSYYEERGEL